MEVVIKNIEDIKNKINAFYKNHQDDCLDSQNKDLSDCVEESIEMLDCGELKTCSIASGAVQVHEWVKKAILLYFVIRDMKIIESPPFSFVDKIPLKKWSGQEGVRVVPQALVRRGAFVDKGAILMPSYVNIGAHVGSETMVDTWATVGSCAYVGKRVHLSGGVGIGGVLEPLQASPVIIEDDVFVGSRSLLVEGIHVEEKAVVGAGTVLTGSTPIIDVTGDKEKIYKKRIPKNSIVIPGMRRKKYSSGEYGLPCALIVGQRNSSTDSKTALSDALRESGLSPPTVF